VEHGGGLLASYAASLYNAAGERQQTIALEDLLRVRPVAAQGDLAATLESYQCMTGGPNDLYLAPHAGADRTLVPLWYFEPVEALPGATRTWDIVTGDGRRAILPGVVSSRHGRGRVVYLASSLESLYGSTRQADLGRFLRQLLASVTPAEPPYRVDAPSLLVTNLTQNGSRYVLHFLNWTGEAENDGSYLPPVENVELRWTIPEGKSVRSVSALVDTPMRYEQSGRELRVRLPRVEAYQALAIEVE
jgi:hypothetical protein